MSGVAGEGTAGGGSGQAQALKDAGTGFNFLRPGFPRFPRFPGFPVSGFQSRFPVSSPGFRFPVPVSGFLACERLGGVDGGGGGAVSGVVGEGASLGDAVRVQALKNTGRDLTSSVPVSVPVSCTLTPGPSRFLTEGDRLQLPETCPGS